MNHRREDRRLFFVERKSSDALHIEMMPMDIQNGDWVTHPGWRHGPVKVIDQNWALRAVAIQLGPNGGIVVWPMDADMKRTSSPNGSDQPPARG